MRMILTILIFIDIFKEDSEGTDEDDVDHIDEVDV